MTILLDQIAKTPFSATNTADITTTTAVEIKAAVAGKRHWITGATCINKTDVETPFIGLQGDGDVLVDVFAPGDPAIVAGGDTHYYNPPLVIPSGEAIEGIALLAALGDCIIAVHGYVED